MLKKIFVVIIIILMIGVLCLGCKEPDKDKDDDNNQDTTWKKVRVADSSMYSDNGYIDYAKDVYFDDEEHPELAETGLFWTYWDDDAKKIQEVAADSQEGAALIDPQKPTIIMVHGMLSNGHLHGESFRLNGDIAVPSEFGLDDDNGVSLARLWINEGWNVGYFNYNKFTADTYSIIESKIWSSDAVVGSGKYKQEIQMRYRKENGDYVYNPTSYSLAEHFAAEYVRAMNLLPEDMGSKEIRVAAHSMGGQLTSASIFLLTELADVGQLDKDKLPDRYAMLDPFFGINFVTNGEYIYAGMGGYTIRWSGKKLYNDNTGYTTLEALKDIAANGIVIEYYTFIQGTLRLFIPPEVFSAFRQISVCVMANPDYENYNEEYDIVMDGHNGVRDWYLCSITADPVRDVTEGQPEGALAASATTPTEVIKQLKGVYFEMYQGAQTVPAHDDTFIRAN